MKKNFFDLVNSDFFRPFVGKNKEVNFELLNSINERMNLDNGQLEKAEIIDIIERYYASRPYLVNYDDENDELKIDRRVAPSSKIRYFEKLGWLTSEVHEHFTVWYQMEPAANMILTAMRSFILRDEKPIEPTGFVYLIYKAFETFDLDHSTEITEQIDRLSDGLNENLNAVNSKIKAHLNSLLKDENQEPRKILDEVLCIYQKNVVARAFENLRTKDNPSLYVDEIKQRIDDLKFKHMNELVDNYIVNKLRGEHNEENDREARVFFNDIFSKVRNQFTHIEERIEMLEQRNSKYIHAAQARLFFLLNDKNNIEGRIDRLLKTMEDYKNDDDNEEFEFDLHEMGKINETSPYTYVRVKRGIPSVASDEENEMTEEDEQRLMAAVMRGSKFTIAGVNNYILDCLGENASVQASNIKVNDYDEWTMLFLAKIYSQSEAIDYQIEFLDKPFYYENEEAEDFIITRRTK